MSDADDSRILHTNAAAETTDPLDTDTIGALASLVANDDARTVDDPDPSTLTADIVASEEPAVPEVPSTDEETPSADNPASPTPAATDAASTNEIDRIELAALMTENANPSQTLPFTPIPPAAVNPVHTVERISGSAKGTGSLAWGSRTDVGRVRDHNEDSFVIRFPLFAVADGMGGHAAGEVASTIAVTSLANSAPAVPDASALAGAIEAANLAVLEGAQSGLGRPGMGTTCTSVIIDGNIMAVGHVGDSRCYLLHAGQLVRITHDHSYVEELVAAGEITPEEARIHPNRSVITRALGSDPKMRADSFTVNVARGDRVLVCSDGLSSMITDDVIEEAMVSTVAPQACADALVGLALGAGGHDNVTCIVIDVKDDGVARRALMQRLRNIAICLLVALAVATVTLSGLVGIARSQWYLIDQAGYVTLYRGIPGAPGIFGLNTLQEATTIKVSQLSEAVGKRLATGISFESEADARATIDSYTEQLSAEADSAAANSQKVSDARSAASADAAQASEDAAAIDTTNETAVDGIPIEESAPIDASTNPAPAGAEV